MYGCLKQSEYNIKTLIKTYCLMILVFFDNYFYSHYHLLLLTVIFFCKTANCFILVINTF